MGARHGHVIFRYPNRKLYDGIISKYVTLEAIKGYVVTDDAFEVRDFATGCDETLAILCQVLHYQIKNGAEVSHEAVIALIKEAYLSNKEPS